MRIFASSHQLSRRVTMICDGFGLDRSLGFLLSWCVTFPKSSHVSSHLMGKKATVVDHTW